MQNALKKQLTDAGLDVESSIKRFSMNEKLYCKCIVRFITEPTYEQLVESMEAGDYAEAHRFAHTLKGISGNLGMDKLYNECSTLSSLLKENQYDASLPVYEDVRHTYDEILSHISTVDFSEYDL